MVRTSAYGYLNYGVESTFQSEAGTKNRVFGLEQKISGLQFTNNRINLGQLNTPELQSFAFGKNEGKMSVEYILSNPWFFDAIITPYTKTAGTPNSFYWTTDATGSGGVIRTVPSISMDIGFQAEASSGLNMTRTPLGAIVNQIAIKTSMNETVKCTADILWGLEKGNTGNLWATSGNSYGTAKTDDINFPYTFVHGSFTSSNYGSGAVAQVQSVDLTINNNVELLWGIGSANAVSAVRKTLDVTGSFNVAVTDDSWLYAAMQRSELTNFVLTFDNGLASNSQRKIVISGTGMAIADHSVDLPVPIDAVYQDVNFQIRKLNITAYNSQSGSP